MQPLVVGKEKQCAIHRQRAADWSYFILLYNSPLLRIVLSLSLYMSYVVRMFFNSSHEHVVNSIQYVTLTNTVVNFSTYEYQLTVMPAKHPTLYADTPRNRRGSKMCRKMFNAVPHAVRRSPHTHSNTHTNAHNKAKVKFRCLLSTTPRCTSLNS